MTISEFGHKVEKTVDRLRGTVGKGRLIVM